MSDAEFFKLAVHEYGIAPKLAEFLILYISRRPHTHTSGQITDFKPSVAEIVEDVLAEEVDEE